MSPTLSTASQTSFVFTPPTPRTNPSTPSGTISTHTGQGYAPRPPITKAIDIWALGVTLYCFVYGRCPFIADTEFELFNMIPRKKPEYFDSVPGREFVCPELKDLLSRLLEKDVGKRITLKEVKVCEASFTRNRLCCFKGISNVLALALCSRSTHG